MGERPKTTVTTPDLPLTMIRRLIEQKRFRDALREIEVVERDLGVALMPSQRGELSYLACNCLYYLGNYTEALAKAKFAYQVFKSTTDSKKVAQIQHRLGMINMSLGNLRLAELHLRDAISTYRRFSCHVELIHSHNRIAQVYFVRGDFEKATDCLNEAKTLSRKIGDEWRAAMAAGNLGTVYLLMGRWRESEENLETSFAYHSTNGDQLNLCAALLSLGFLSYLRRDFGKSRSFLSKAFKLAQKNDSLRELAIYHEYAGQLAHAENKQEEAKAHFLKAIEIGRTAAPVGDINSQTYRLLAELQVDQEDFSEALISCEKSLDVSKSLGEKIEEGAVYRILGQIYCATGERKKSCECFEKGISILQQIGARYELARTYLKAGRSSSFDYYRRLGFLSNAESLFRQLESKYHIGLVNLAIAHLLVQEKEHCKAQVFLSEAERLFRQTKDQRELRQVRDLRESVEQSLSRRRIAANSDGALTFDNVVTENPEMKEIIEKLKQVMNYDLTILLQGETGTGKDLLAKAVHFSSQRRDKRFVAVNCAALPESLLENELFGHRKGAYTGADKDRPGLFEEAKGGTLYLDQVEEIPMSTQVKLLRAIEEKEITRLGDTTPRKIDVNIVSSSIKDLKEAVKNGTFRQDLYYRLNTFKVKIPPLQDRKEDIRPLVRYFLRLYKVDEKGIGEFERNGTLERFREYGWPGNVRELQNEMKRMVVLTEVGNNDPSSYLSDKFNQPGGDRPSLFDQMAQFEKNKIMEALRQCNWVKLRAAKFLRVPEGTLRSKMKKHKIPMHAPI